MSVAEGLKEAKLDIDKAQEHGVLAPPPPGAGWAKRMFHHARELFVRPLHPDLLPLVSSPLTINRNFTGMVSR